jgi:hypothetical protein
MAHAAAELHHVIGNGRWAMERDLPTWTLCSKAHFELLPFGARRGTATSR